MWEEAKEMHLQPNRSINLDHFGFLLEPREKGSGAKRTAEVQQYILHIELPCLRLLNRDNIWYGIFESALRWTGLWELFL